MDTDAAQPAAKIIAPKKKPIKRAPNDPRKEPSAKSTSPKPTVKKEDSASKDKEINNPKAKAKAKAKAKPKAKSKPRQKSKLKDDTSETDKDS